MVVMAMVDPKWLAATFKETNPWGIFLLSRKETLHMPAIIPNANGWVKQPFKFDGKEIMKIMAAIIRRKHLNQ